MKQGSSGRKAKSSFFGKVSRRDFVKKNSVAGVSIALGLSPALVSPGKSFQDIPALAGGQKVRSKPWPGWPVWDTEKDEQLVLKVLRSGVWSRAGMVSEFEKKWASAVGSKRCLAVVNGTNALIAAMVQLGIGGGDEVLVPPYTFIATVAAILQTGAIPVFVDTDPETFQIDVSKIEAKITQHTKAIVPVHILGLPADMTSIMEIARKHNLLVVEDACQAWLAEINHKKVGTFGNAGCFSFQNSKNLPIGEGGAIVSDDDALIDRCYSFHNYGNPYGSVVGSVGSATVMTGTKLRMAEYQAAIGLAQMERLETQTTKRNENAAYLKSKLEKIPGILPYRLNPGVTRAAFHLFPFRFMQEEFKGITQGRFIAALRAEGITCSPGYSPLNKMPFLKHAFSTKNYRLMYPPERLDYNKYMVDNQCPANDKLCTQAVWFEQNMLLADKQDMDDIVSTIEKIHIHADKIAQFKKID